MIIEESLTFFFGRNLFRVSPYYIERVPFLIFGILKIYGAQILKATGRRESILAQHDMSIFTNNIYGSFMADTIPF